MSLKYKILKKNALMLSFSFACFPLLLFIIVGLPVFFPKSADESSIALIVMFIPFLFIPIVAFIIYSYLKEAELIIDEIGIRTNSKLLQMLPNFATIKFNHETQVVQVNDFIKNTQGNLVTRFDKRLTNHDSILHISNKKQANKKFLISDNLWNIDDITEITRWLEQRGYAVDNVNPTEFAKQHIPAVADLGKRAGFFAYLSIAIAILCIILPMFDDWSTIYYGAFQHSLWGVFVVAFLFAFFILKQAEDNKTNQFGVNLMISGLFASTSTFLFLLGMLLVIPFLGTKTTVTFQYDTLNDYKEEIWIAKDNPDLKIFCEQAPNESEHQPQVAEIVQFTSVIRVNGKKLCPQSKFLNDGTLPHK